MNRAPLAGLLLVGFALRLVGLEVHSMWLDEGETLAVIHAADPLGLLGETTHPPLSFLALRAWSALLGEADWALRLLPALLSCASLVLFAGLARRWLRAAAVLPGIALYAASPFLVWYGQELRMYAFVELAALLVVWGVARSLEGRGGWLLTGLGTALAFGSHYLGPLVCFGGLAVLLIAWRAQRLPRRALLAQGAAMLVGALVWLPWLVTMLPAQAATVWPGIARRAWRDLLELPPRLVLVELAAVPGALVLGVSAGILAALLLGLIAGWRHRRLEDAWGPVLFVGPVTVAFLLSFVTQPRFLPRYLIAAAPGLCLTVATGFGCVRPAALRQAVAWGTVAGCLAIAIVHKTENRKDDFRGACADLVASWRDGESVVVVTGTPRATALAPLQHYLRDRPEIVARLRWSRDEGSLPVGRFHVHYRASVYATPLYRSLFAGCRVVHEGPPRLRAQHLILVRDG